MDNDDIGVFLLKFKKLFDGIMPHTHRKYKYRYKFSRLNRYDDETTIVIYDGLNIHKFDYDICTVCIILDDTKHGTCKSKIVGEHSNVWLDKHGITCHLNRYFYTRVVNMLERNLHKKETITYPQNPKTLHEIALHECGKKVLVQKNELPAFLTKEVQILNLYYALKPYLCGIRVYL